MKYSELPKDFLLINKPVGWTSFDIINYIRKGLRKKQHEAAKNSIDSPDTNVPTPPKFGLRVGHTGTLDPFATGLLIIGVGRDATKRLDEFKDLPKTYVATIRLGATSDTYDATGHITLCHPEPACPAGRRSEGSKRLDPSALPSSGPQDDNDKFVPTLEKIIQTLKSFNGQQEQLPPMHSAKKVDGVRLYKLARQGQTIERRPHVIEIYEIKLIDFSWPHLKIEVSCSAGTYIRTLAYDIGEKLGVGGYCEGLVRTKIGPYSIEDAADLKNLDLTI